MSRLNLARYSLGMVAEERNGTSLPQTSISRLIISDPFLLRCVELGVSIHDLDLLTIGLVTDMWTERANDGVKYRQLATQEDFDKF